MGEFIVKNGNNVPIQSPLIPDPFVPYECKNYRNIFAICQGDERQIKKYLAPTPFDYVNDQFFVCVTDFSNTVWLGGTPKREIPYMDSCLIFPVRYKDILGGYVVFEYEDQDYAIAAGRDLWGYPKKYGEITLKENKKIVKGKVIRNKKTIIEITCDLSKPIKNVPEVKITPHLCIHVVPKPDGPGIFSKRIISRNTSPDFKLISNNFGQTEVHLEGVPTDPLHELRPKKVLGGGLTVGDFLASEKNGWGKILETLIYNP